MEDNRFDSIINGLDPDKDTIIKTRDGEVLHYEKIMFENNEMQKSLQTELDALEPQVALLKNGNESLAAEIDSLKTRIPKIDAEASTLRYRIKTAEAILNKISTYRSKIDSLNEEISKAENELNNITEQKERRKVKGEALLAFWSEHKDLIKESIIGNTHELDFDDGKVTISSDKIQTIITNMYSALVEKSKKVDRDDFFDYGMLFANGFIKEEAKNTLIAIAYGVIEICEGKIDDALVANCRNSLNDVFEFPSDGNINRLFNAIKNCQDALSSESNIETNAKNAQKQFALDNLLQIITSIVNIFMIDYPKIFKLEFRDKFVNCDVERLTLKQVETLEHQLTEIVPLCYDEFTHRVSLTDMYTSCLITLNFDRAIKHFQKKFDYKTKGALYENTLLLPVYSSAGNSEYPSINTGIVSKKIAAWGETVFIYRMIQFFGQPATVSDNIISIVCDASSQRSREIAQSSVHSVLASLMAWCGPRNFTLDVIDFNKTHTTSYISKFLSPDCYNLVEVGDDLSQLDATISAFERIVGERAKIMSSIFEYNKQNSQKQEPYKIVFVNDYNRELSKSNIKANYEKGRTSLEKECDSAANRFDSRTLTDCLFNLYKLEERTEQLLAIAERFKKLREIGYRYGFCFVVCSQIIDTYQYGTSLPRVDCRDGKLSVMSSPFSMTIVEGVSRDDKDWFMKWLRGKDEVSSSLVYECSENALNTTESTANKRRHEEELLQRARRESEDRINQAERIRRLRIAEEEKQERLRIARRESEERMRIANEQARRNAEIEGQRRKALEEKEAAEKKAAEKRAAEERAKEEWDDKVRVEFDYRGYCNDGSPGSWRTHRMFIDRDVYIALIEGGEFSIKNFLESEVAYCELADAKMRKLGF